MRLPEGLPELKGRWAAAYKGVWWIVLALALVSSTAGVWAQLRFGANLDRQVYGAGVRLNIENGTTNVSPISPAARQAGLVDGSTVLAADGRAVAMGSKQEDIANLGAMLDGPDGKVNTLLVRTPAGTRQTVRIVRGPEHLAAADREASVPYAQRRAFNLFSLAASLLIALTAGILLYTRRRNDAVAAILSLALLLVDTNNLVALLDFGPIRDAVAKAINIAGLALIATGAAVFPTGRFSPRWSLLVLPAIAVAAWIILSDGAGLPDAAQFAISYMPMFLAAAVLIARFRRMEAGPSRQQMKWVMLGFTAMVGLTAVRFGLNVIDKQVTDNATHFGLLVAMNLVQLVGNLCGIGGILISLLRHRLYDADVAISRSALYGGLTVMLIAIFAGFEKLIETLGEEWYGSSVGAAAGAIAAALAALFLVPLHHRMSHWAEKRFQKDIAGMRARLPELLAELRDSDNPRVLADDALRLALHGVRAKHGAIALAEEGRLALGDAQGIDHASAEAALAELPHAPQPGLERRDESAFPLRLPLLTPSGTLAGWLLLGPHPDGSLYGKEDREALEEIASPLARALALSLDRARRAQVREAERSTMMQHLERLEAALASLVGLVGPSRTPARKR